MLILLPLLALVLLALCVRSRLGCGSWRETLLTAAVAWGVLLVLITEGLSLFGGVGGLGLSLSWLAVCLVAALGIHGARLRNLLRVPAPTTPLGIDERLLLAGLALYLLGTAVIALVAPPNTWDALEYHLPKVMHWLQNGSVSFYPTPTPRQNHLAPGAEFVILHFHALWGSDRLTNMVAWLSMSGCLAGVSLLARELGAGRRGQLLSAVFAATLPMGIMQASSAQTDYVVAFWFVCSLWFLLRLIKSQTLSAQLLFGFAAALGLAALTKATVYLFAPFFLLWLALVMLKRWRWRALFCFGLFALVFLLLNLGHYSRNSALYGHPLGPRHEPEANTEYMQGTFAPKALLSSLSKHLGTHVNTPWPKFNAALSEAWKSWHRLIGFEANDRRTTFGPDWVKFRISRTSYHDEVAGNPVHLVLALVAFGMVLLVPPLRRNPLLLAYTLALIAGFVLLACFLRWHPWMSRLHHGLFVAAAPFVAVALTAGKRAWPSSLVAGLLLLLGLPWLLLCTQRPLLAQANIFNTDRTSIYYFNPHQHYQASFEEGAAILDGLSYERVGLITGNTSWEYLWWLYAQRNHPTARLRHVNVSDPSARLTPELPGAPFEPEVIITLDQGPQTPGVLTLDGSPFTLLWTKDQVAIYLAKKDQKAP